MKESLPSPEEDDKENGRRIHGDLHDIHNLLNMLPDVSNEKVKKEILGLTQKILALQGLILSKVNDINDKKDKAFK
jgi:hypothetical protein